MKSINKFFSSVAEACSPSKGTLSGAMDVVVIRRPDGTMASTPFYVKFGRFKLINSNNITVSLNVNSILTPLEMKLKKSGRAVFCRDLASENPSLFVPENPNIVPEDLDQEAEAEVEAELDNEEDLEDQEDEFLLLPKESEANSFLPLEISSRYSQEIKNPQGIQIDNPDEVLKKSVSYDYSEAQEELKSSGFSEGGELKSSSVSEGGNPSDRRYRSNSVLVSSSNNLSSDELQQLGLLPGLNVVIYITHTKKQVYLVGKIFLFDSSTKLVVSDIDGTLTKSDLMGHICYMMGKDWSRGGVVSLYNSIVKRNYTIIYLSSRSLGQIESTRSYLDCVDQGGEKLPIGPLLLSPDSMFTSIVREISNYAQVFKEKTLKEILQLYPPNVFPFYAGFGNRDGDAVAYQRTGIPMARIFILKSAKKSKEKYSCIKNFNEVSLNLDENFP